jgi:chaperonin GroEL
MWVLCSQLISEDLGLKLEKVKPDMLGSAKRVTISKDDTIILDGGCDKKDIEERCEQVQSIFS